MGKSGKPGEARRGEGLAWFLMIAASSLMSPWWTVKRKERYLRPFKETAKGRQEDLQRQLKEKEQQR